MKTTSLSLPIIVLALAGAAAGQDKQPWSGIKVVTKYAQPIRMGEKIVDDGTTFRVYVVKVADGDRLQVAWGDSKGWVDSFSVVPLDEAVDFYSREIDDNPGNSSAYNWRGMVHGEKKFYDLAIADYDRSIALEPSSAFAWNNRGNIWLDKKDYDKAITDFDRAILLDPDHALAHCNRGIARQRRHEFEAALADYARAIQLKPDYASPYNERAWLWSTCPTDSFRDGDKALASATKACELTGYKDANFVDTLAASYAELGLFEQATRWQSKAMGLVKPGNPSRKEFALRLELYNKRAPYRTP